jgi:hypothetical protein
LVIAGARHLDIARAEHMIVGDDNATFTASLAEFLATLPGRPA